MLRMQLPQNFAKVHGGSGRSRLLKTTCHHCRGSDKVKLVKASGGVAVPQNDPDFNCGTFVKDATAAARKSECLRGGAEAWDVIAVLERRR